MALGLTSSLSNSLFLEVPFSLETSIQSSSESVQYMFRETQSMERPSGDFNPENRQEHSILNTTHCTQRGPNPQMKCSVTYKANLFSLLGLRHHDWIENHSFIEWWIFYQSLTWYYPVEVWAVGSHMVNASLYHIRVIYATISAITVHTNNQLICNSQSKHCIKPALPIKGNTEEWTRLKDRDPLFWLVLTGSLTGLGQDELPGTVLLVDVDTADGLTLRQDQVILRTRPCTTEQVISQI